MNIKILDIEYELKENSPRDWSVNGMGRSSLLNGQISIREGLPQNIKHATIMHEIIHQISDILDLGIDDSENVISGMATGIYSVIKNNPVFVKEILGLK